MWNRILVPNHGLNPHTLHWKCGVLTTGSPGMSLNLFFFKFLPQTGAFSPRLALVLLGSSMDWILGQRPPQVTTGHSAIFREPTLQMAKWRWQRWSSLLVTWVALPVSCRILYLGTWAMQPTIRCPLAEHSCQCKQPTMNWSPVCDQHCIGPGFDTCLSRAEHDVRGRGAIWKMHCKAKEQSPATSQLLYFSLNILQYIRY